jgi:4-hydroxy-tetrahydrodipicolinate synthase
MRLVGTHVALVTPFKDGAVDEGAFRGLIDHVIEGGVEGIVPCGTTGETPTLSKAEIARVISLAVEHAAGRVSVIAGSGSNSTAATIENTRAIRELGVDAALIVTPYYNKPSQAGLVAHYEAVASSVPGFPIVLYNVPGRTGCNLLPETVEKLSHLDEVIAVKEASGDLAQVQAILDTCGERLTVLSGDDALSLPMYALGGHGVITVAGNVAPKDMSDLHRVYQSGDIAGAAAIQSRLNPLFEALFCEPNPQPCKAALALMGKMNNELRLPLVPVTDATLDRIRAVLTELGCLG